MEQNLITDKRLRAVCRYAEHVGLKYYGSFNVHDFKVIQHSVEQSFFNYRSYFKRRDMRSIKTTVRKFYNGYKENPNIEKLGLSIEKDDSTGAALFSFLVRYKLPDAADVDLFIDSFKTLVEGFGYKWDETIPNTAEFILNYDITMVNQHGQVERYCNPLNTGIHGFLRSNKSVEFYFGRYGLLMKFLARHAYSAFYIRRDWMKNGHSVLTFLAKP